MKIKFRTQFTIDKTAHFKMIRILNILTLVLSYQKMVFAAVNKGFASKYEKSFAISIKPKTMWSHSTSLYLIEPV
ncbi:hypothetical protein BpHYR1_003172 [Brachionus plicatilis]|uniref:Uncharacterized protein n=1 Tax=Brachionus plicatilis TaxID=10195 RepID=A0A3M7P2Y7_BRAPC|nr:hypothetical protein BpHYR1_003172 [Brachionus plicatilis]